MWDVIKKVFGFTVSKYYIKVRVDNQDVDIVAITDIFRLLSGSSNEIILADVSGDIQIVAGKK
jgi:hypothetical protein